MKYLRQSGTQLHSRYRWLWYVWNTSNCKAGTLY